jgi:hypothetical protein
MQVDAAGKLVRLSVESHQASLRRQVNRGGDRAGGWMALHTDVACVHGCHGWTTDPDASFGLKRLWRLVGEPSYSMVVSLPLGRHDV